MCHARIVCALIVVVACIPYTTGQFVEECVHGNYPPTSEKKVPHYVVDLDKPAIERWKALGKAEATQISNLVYALKKFLRDVSPSTKALFDFVDKHMGSMADTMPYPFGDELKGMAAGTGLPLGEIVLYNIFYEVFSLCTSIVAEDPTGKLFHARNLDFGLFMGWEPKNHTWAITEALKPTVVNLDYQRGGRTVFKTVTFSGYIGVLTGVKPGILTLTMNERFALNGGYVGIIEWVFGMRDSKWMGFLTREVLENATSYSEARDSLANTPILSPAYFILGGNTSGQACIITRARGKALDVWDLGQKNSSWYLLETNYDNWKSPLFLDDRRTPAHHCMEKLTQQNVNFAGIFDVLSTKPMLNKLTAYTALMEVSTGRMESYLQHCPDPCPAW